MLNLLPIASGPVLAGGVLGGLGAPELIVILIVVLIIFGPKQLPKIGRALGTSIRELKDAANKITGEDDEEYSSPPARRSTQPEGTVASTPAAGEEKKNEAEPAAAPAEEPPPPKMSAGPNVS